MRGIQARPCIMLMSIIEKVVKSGKLEVDVSYLGFLTWLCGPLSSYPSKPRSGVSVVFCTLSEIDR